MIIETVAIAVLAASSLSDAERRRAGSMAAMGHWERAFNRMGPGDYYEFFNELPPGRTRSAALIYLKGLYLKAFDEQVCERSNFRVAPAVSVPITLARDHTWVPGWAFVTDEQAGRFAPGDLYRGNYIKAAKALYESSAVRFLPIPNTSRGQGGVWVRGEWKIVL